MGYGDVRERYAKGDLNALWGAIEVAGKHLPSEHDNIEHLKGMFIRYGLVKPWPLIQGEEPEYYEVKFFAREYADFNYLLGLGVTLREVSQAGDDAKDAFDLESAILSSCLERAERHEAEKKARTGLLIDFLASHVGENPTRNQMRDASGSDLVAIRETIETLKENQILDIDKKRFIVSFDADAARALLLPGAEAKFA